jgi:hypothetical protein
VNPRYTALGAKPEGTRIMGKLADAVAPKISPALFRTAAGKAVLTAHGIAGLATDSNENETTEPELNMPDEKTALNTPLNTLDDSDGGTMVAVPVAPETGEEKFNGLETGNTVNPVRVTIKLEFEGMLDVKVKFTKYLTFVAPASELLTETAGAELNKLKMAGKRPAEVIDNIVPVLENIPTATLVIAACAK